MAAVLTENFETAVGYDTGGWTETAAGGSTVNEDAAAGSGFPNGWGNQCLQITRVASTDAYTYNIFGATVITFSRVEVRFSAVSIASDGDVVEVALGLDAGVTVAYWAAVARKIGGVDYIEFQLIPDGVAAVVLWRQPVALNKLYSFEVKWDTTADVWELWVNGIPSGSGALTGASATTPIGTVLLGGFTASLPSYTAMFDRILVDNSTRIGADNAGPNAIRMGRRPKPHTLNDEGRFNELNIKTWW